MRLRSVPALKFFYDEVQQTGSALSSLIDDAVATNTTDPDLQSSNDVSPTSESSKGAAANKTDDVGAGAVNASVWKKSL